MLLREARDHVTGMRYQQLEEILRTVGVDLSGEGDVPKHWQIDVLRAQWPDFDWNHKKIATKWAQNLIAAIDRSRQTTLERFLFALGMTHVGETTAKALAHSFGDLAIIRQLPGPYSNASRILEAKWHVPSATLWTSPPTNRPLMT